jgi:hypothetical protein
MKRCYRFTPNGLIFKRDTYYEVLGEISFDFNQGLSKYEGFSHLVISFETPISRIISLLITPPPPSMTSPPPISHTTDEKSTFTGESGCG